MSWWGSLLLWAGLVAALLVMLSWFAWSLFQKFMNTLDALGDLSDQIAAATPQDGPKRTAQQVPAIFGDRNELAALVERQRVDRAERAQMSRDRRVNRGKLLSPFPRY
jgi:hypothetical protein